MNAWLVLSHLATLIIGAGSGVAFVRSRPVREAITHEEHDVTDTPKPTRRVRLAQVVHGKGPTPGALALFLILAGLVVVGFGIQQARFQAVSNDRDQCVETWGHDLVTTTENRVGATRRFERASDRREDALDAIVLTVAAGSLSRGQLGKVSEQLGEDPLPPATTKAFQAVLLEFVLAKIHRDKVRDARDKTRRKNPYPELDLNCEPSESPWRWIWNTVTP